MTLNTTRSNVCDQMYPIYMLLVSPSPKFQSLSLYVQSFSSYMSFLGHSVHLSLEIGTLKEVHWMTPEWPWALQSQWYTIYVLLVYPDPKFYSVLLHDEPFSRIMVVEKRKCIELPHNDKQLTAKSILYTLNHYLWGPTFRSVSLTSSYYGQYTWLSRIGNAPYDPKLPWTLNGQKYSETKYFPQMLEFWPFHSTTCRFRDIKYFLP